MLQSSFVNPALLELLMRVRHTNTLVICDVGFPSWPGSKRWTFPCGGGWPSVLDVCALLKPEFVIGGIWQAEEFVTHNDPETVARLDRAFEGSTLTREPHHLFKSRVPDAVGIIRTGDDVPYANLILESA